MNPQLYRVCFYDCGLQFVRAGKYPPFESFHTGNYELARRECLQFTEEDHHCSAVIVNNETGNRLYFEKGKEE